MNKMNRNKRSYNLSRIRSGNTKPERLIRSLLYRKGFRYRIHRKDIPGKPGAMRISGKNISTKSVHHYTASSFCANSWQGSEESETPIICPFLQWIQ
ncbi:MAG: very short patch repair endonuclease [Candidatus Eremiobacteraeota bacterium]|nr:very short patch repair endonuclease [Candidatus Eremiobacteraeota bacterium]